MPQIFVLGGKDVGRSFDVSKAAVLGRGTDCDVRLADRSVSRRHARIESDGGRWFVVDLGSRNGVKLRGERVQRAELADHDEIVLGELPLRFRLTGPTEDAAPAPETEPEITLEPAPEPASGPKPEPEPASGFELEEDIQLGETVTARPRRGPPLPGPELEPPEPEPKPPSVLSERERRRAEILAQPGAGFLSGDLSQSPLWIRWSTYLLVTAVMVGLFYGVYKLVAYLRGSL
ncbi:MAG: FHA domain-containing protein [Planctomycetota bacterium]|nr:FHA domain-containing protein [Planctomycetota bacterium]